MKYLYWILGIIAFFAVLFLLNVGGMYSKSFFGTWNEEIRYDIQKESQAHRDGLQRNLSQLMIQHDAAGTAGRVGIQATVRHQYSQADTAEYPAHLQTFLSQMGL
jgi:hypothetical protein